MLWYELNGEPVQPLYTTRPPHKMISRGGTIGEPTYDPNIIFAWVVRNLERLVAELHFHEACTEHLNVWLGGKGVGLSGNAPLPSPTDRFDHLLEAAKYALRKAWRPGLSLNRVHLLASKLRYRGSVQLGLFDVPDETAQAIARVKKEINDRFGRFTLRSGATLYLDEIYQDAAHNYDICDVHGKMCC
jgi:DNA polymerase V